MWRKDSKDWTSSQSAAPPKCRNPHHMQGKQEKKKKKKLRCGCSVGGGLMFLYNSKQLIWAQDKARSPDIKGRRPDDWQVRWLVGGLYDCFCGGLSLLKRHHLSELSRTRIIHDFQGRVHTVRGPLQLQKGPKHFAEVELAFSEGKRAATGQNILITNGLFRAADCMLWVSGNRIILIVNLGALVAYFQL